MHSTVGPSIDTYIDTASTALKQYNALTDLYCTLRFNHPPLNTHCTTRALKGFAVLVSN
jgi:hypothetical protein